jgi:hypothetical protein
LQRLTSKHARFGWAGGERGKASMNLKSTGHFNLDCRLSNRCVIILLPTNGLRLNEQAAKLSHKDFQCIRISVSKA